MNPYQSQPGTLEVKEDDFHQQVLKAPEPVLVEFWAPWSRPCQVLDSVLNELAAGLPGKLKIVKVNADDCLELSLLYEIQSVPTMIYFVQGRPCLRIVGTASKEAILSRIESYRAAA